MGAGSPSRYALLLCHAPLCDACRCSLQVQVIDVGIGLERIPWLINGSPTSYVDVFPSGLKYLLSTLNLELNNEVWQKFGPYSCLLNVDEVGVMAWLCDVAAHAVLSRE